MLRSCSPVPRARCGVWGAVCLGFTLLVASTCAESQAACVRRAGDPEGPCLPPGWFEYGQGHPVVHAGLPSRDKLNEVILSVSFPRTGSTWLYQMLEKLTLKEGCAGVLGVSHPMVTLSLMLNSRSF